MKIIYFFQAPENSTAANKGWKVNNCIKNIGQIVHSYTDKLPVSTSGMAKGQTLTR